MHYYKFARRNNGTLKFIFKVDEKHVNLPSTDGCIYYSEEEINNVKDLFVVEKMRIVKSGKTWINSKIKY